MNELELRQYVVSTAERYAGTTRGSAKFEELRSIYNNFRPLARGYAVTATDPYCAMFGSAIAIKCGLTNIIPTECGCEKMIQLFKALGRWEEDESITPLPGDLIFYDWDDSGVGDCFGVADHVGYVVGVKEGKIRCIEGNINGGTVGYRTIALNAKFIRGFGRPDYASVADKEPAAGEPDECAYIGVDISNHEKTVNYEAVAGAIDFAILKVSEGTFYTDAYFDGHYNGLREHGVPVGAYVYSHAKNAADGRLEAEYALNLLKGRYLELPIFIDIEGDMVQAGAGNCMAAALSFGETVTAAGYRWGVYTSSGKFNGFLDAQKLHEAGAVIWSARYSENEPAGYYDIWQYADNGKVNGITKGVDMNKMVADVIVKEPVLDIGECPTWAKESCVKAVKAGAIHGDGVSYGWNEPITKAHIAVILDNLKLLG